MKFMKIITITAIIFGSLCLTAQTNKFGHINSGNLLAMLPESKAADAELDKLQKKLVAKGDSMVADFRNQYEKYMKLASEGTLTQIQQKAKEAELQQQQQTLQNYEQVIKVEVGKKRETLLKPILEKVDLAIQAVGKEEGFYMIFDESTGAMMYSQPSSDILPQVKKKLGL
jgi:outer membrane protein